MRHVGELRRHFVEMQQLYPEGQLPPGLHAHWMDFGGMGFPFGGMGMGMENEDEDEDESYEELLALQERMGGAVQRGASKSQIDRLPTYAFTKVREPRAPRRAALPFCV
eukprot:41629-Prorocentrum_minimum.AAC.1